MNLTIQSLNKAKECCQEYLKLEDVLEKSNQLEMVSDLKMTLVSIDQTLTLLDRVTSVRGTLETYGYSDEWFDTVSINGRIAGLVDIEVPKFFDNNVNRGKACMEGMIDSIKNFIVKICDFIMGVIRKILGFFNITVSILSDDSKMEDRIKQACDDFARKVGEAEAMKYLQTHPFKIEKWYDGEQLKRMMENTIKLLDIIVPGTDFNGLRRGLLDANDYSGTDTPSIRSEYYAKLVASLTSATVQVNDPDTVGFVPINQSDVQSMVMFVGTDKKDFEFKSYEVTIGDWRDFKNLVSDDIREIQPIRKRLIESHVRMKKALEKRHRDAQGINDTIGKMDPDQDRCNFYQREATITACSLAILVSAENFINLLSRYCRINNHARKAMVDALNAASAEIKSANT